MRTEIPPTIANLPVSLSVHHAWPLTDWTAKCMTLSVHHAWPLTDWTAKCMNLHSTVHECGARLHVRTGLAVWKCNSKCVLERAMCSRIRIANDHVGAPDPRLGERDMGHESSRQRHIDVHEWHDQEDRRVGWAETNHDVRWRQRVWEATHASGRIRQAYLREETHRGAERGRPDDLLPDDLLLR